MNRRGFLTGLAATAAGLLIPPDVAAEPERRVWALDSTMLATPKTCVWESGWFDASAPLDKAFFSFNGTYASAYEIWARFETSHGDERVIKMRPGEVWHADERMQLIAVHDTDPALTLAI